MEDIKGMSSAEMVVTFVFMAFFGALLFAIPLFFIIFIFTDWTTAKATTLWWSSCVAIVFSIFATINENEKKEKSDRNLYEAKSVMGTLNFQAKKFFQSDDIYVAIDKDFSRLLISRPGRRAEIIKQEDVYEMVLEVDEEVVSKSSSGMGGSLVGAAVGGVITGGVGAIVGAVAGKNPSHQTKSGIRSVSIKMAVNSNDSPLVVIEFLNSDVTYEKSSMVAKHHLNEANNWWALLTVFMRKDAA